MAVPGIEIVGPFPAELQTYVVLAGGVSASTNDKAASLPLLKFLTGPGAASVIKDKGLEPG
jgi:molybdate transport system substrate-binding protein